MSIFNKITNSISKAKKEASDSVFWEQGYKRSWDISSFYCSRGKPQNPFGSGLVSMIKWIERMHEKRAYYQVHRSKLPATHKDDPSKAALWAKLDLSNEFYEEYGDRVPEEDWQALAEWLAYSADLSKQLPEPWMSFYKTKKSLYNADVARVDEIMSLRFPMSDIDTSWALIKRQSIPYEAERVWEVLCKQWLELDEIASRSKQTLEDCLFWLIVFRENGLIEEVARTPPLFNAYKKHGSVRGELEEKTKIIEDAIEAAFHDRL